MTHRAQHAVVAVADHIVRAEHHAVGPSIDRCRADGAGRIGNRPSHVDRLSHEHAHRFREAAIGFSLHERAWTLRGMTELAIPPEAGAVYEIVIDGLTPDDVREAMRVGLHAACGCENVVMVTAGNYGGKLGPHHFHLKELI